ncbi:MAG: hypothetical protein AAGJ52_09375 [Pseudomonadota bacterium]
MMYRFALRLTALLVLTLGLNSAQAQNQVSAEAWMAGMVDTLPDFFCANDQYFMQCFEVTEDECRTVTKQQSELCLEELAPQIPSLLNMPDDGRKWGSDVGRCAGTGYDQVMADRRSSAPRCNPPG